MRCIKRKKSSWLYYRKADNINKKNIVFLMQYPFIKLCRLWLNEYQRVIIQIRII